jgi:hypothetical protein
VITIFIVTAIAHPPVGVNVYVEVPAIEVFITAGFQVPVTPSVDVGGREGGVLFWHSGPIWLNVGVRLGLTVIVNVAVVAHNPAVGVNV